MMTFLKWCMYIAIALGALALSTVGGVIAVVIGTVLTLLFAGFALIGLVTVAVKEMFEKGAGKPK
jgi:hypothetical protein